MNSNSAQSTALTATAATTATNSNSTATVFESSNLTYLQCPLCLDTFSPTEPKRQPRLLPSCAHTICTRCLHQQWAIQSSEMIHPTFLCPIDGHPVRVTQVEDIPLNKILLGLIAIMSTSHTSEAAFRIGQYARARCIEEACENEAVWHCFSDDADMCEAHKQATHDGLKSNITKNHRLCRIEEKEMKKGPDMCQLHHSALLLWCVDCHQHACHACATLPPHSSHPGSLKLLGQHLSNASLGGLGFLAANSQAWNGMNNMVVDANGNTMYYSEQQMQVIMSIVEEEKRMKHTMEKESKDLVQTLQGQAATLEIRTYVQTCLQSSWKQQLFHLSHIAHVCLSVCVPLSLSLFLVIDSNELHTQQSLDTEFDNLIAALEQRRLDMHADLKRQSAAARHQLDARMLQLSLNHSLTNTVLEESRRIMAMNPYTMVSYMDNLVARHEKSLEKFWEYAYESSLVSWFPLRMMKDTLIREIGSLGSIGLPGAPSFRLEECRVDRTTVDLAWTDVLPTSAASGAVAAAASAANGNQEEKTRTKFFTTTPATPATTVSPATHVSFYVLHMSPLDPFDLSQDDVLFTEIYRGPHTSFQVTGLQPGSSYLFRVQAVSLMGEGIWSQKICITTHDPTQSGMGRGGGGGEGGHMNGNANANTSNAHGGSHSQSHHMDAIAQPSPRLQQSLSPRRQLPHHPPSPYIGAGGNNNSMIQSPVHSSPHPLPTHVGASSFASPAPIAAGSPRFGAGVGGGGGVGVLSPSHHTPQPHHLRPSTASSSALHSVVPSRRPSFSAHGGGASSRLVVGPLPTGAIRSSIHPGSHPPSQRTGWEELWKLSVIFREKDTTPLMRFFQPTTPVRKKRTTHGTSKLDRLLDQHFSPQTLNFSFFSLHPSPFRFLVLFPASLSF